MIPSRRWSSVVGLALYLSWVPGTGAQTLTLGPERAVAGGETAVATSASRYGPVGRRDNLWTIAERYTRPPASVHQTVVAIYHLNPQAFLNGDIHRLLRDAYLVLPGQQQVLSRSPRAAEAEYRRLSLGQPSLSRPATATLVPAAVPEEATVGGQPQEVSAGSQRQDEVQSRLLDELREQLTLSNAQLTELNQFNRQLRQHVSALSDEVQELKVTREAPPASEPGWSVVLADNKPYLLLVSLLILLLLFKRWGRQQPAAAQPAAMQGEPRMGAGQDRLTIRLPPTAPTSHPEELSRTAEAPVSLGLNLVDTSSRYVPSLDDPRPAPSAHPDAERTAATEDISAPVSEAVPEPVMATRGKAAPAGLADKEVEFRLEVGLDEYAAVLGHQEVDVDQDEGGIGAKLDLARAYIEIGEQGGARTLLKQALKRGTAEQQQEAKKLLQRL
ncbi:FimV/HubP family polar landmark protein [Zobellella maritima]|uniref:FimV/HubP family polar landmark protein n=1 Tax=Zobellella maritima TaxID=2059725 RepID=UPI000E30A46A|nr:FimV/HubP family polar landmark protein [Zobellella maritima]